MSRTGRQFILMLWKNVILQKRKPILTLIEILLPLALAGLLIVVRSGAETTSYPEPTFFDKVRIDQDMRVSKTDILYTPNNTATRTVMDAVCRYCTALPVATEEKMIEAFDAMGSGPDMYDWFGGVVFEGDFSDDGQTFPSKLTLRIRPTDYYVTWSTDLTYSVLTSNNMRAPFGSGGYPYYIQNNFVAVQYLVTKSVLNYINSSIDLAEDTQLWLQRIPYPPYISDGYQTALLEMLPRFIMVAFLIYAIQLTREIVQEKELKLQETMKMMGLNNFINWAAWFVRAFLMQTVAILLLLIMLVLPVGKNGQSCLGHTDPSVFLIFMLAYAISAITFSFAVTTFFKKANVATVACLILYVLSSVPYNLIAHFYSGMKQPLKLASCLLFNTAMSMGAFLIGVYEGTGEGLQWSNINTPATVDDSFTMTDVIFMLLGDSIIHLLITWYVDAINPGEFGAAQPWYFPIMKSYWCGGNATNYSTFELDHVTQDMQSEFFETDPRGLEVGIHMKDLHKTYGSGSRKIVAVDNINLRMYEGQITALLGHNGAGKTTTISMLSGFLSPSSGSAFVNGYDIRTDIANVRENLGLCPQHNVLFDKLTVQEHLMLFGKLKGCYGSSLKTNVEEMIDVIQLRDKKSTLAQKLSGGQKRKLCVGIALVGNSKTIILDEPTSGMDPEARRQVWKILQQSKPGRTILLTTHYMEEADILGDRIAIMVDGVIKCCGTPLFLKHKYGIGYHLAAVKEEGCTVEEVTRLLKAHVPSAHHHTEVGSELGYTLPTEAASQFTAMFQDLEAYSKDLHVASFGVYVTTLEEVFLRVGEGATDDPKVLQRLRRQVSIDATGASANGVRGDRSSTKCSDNEELVDNIPNSTSNESREFNDSVSKVEGMLLVLRQCHAVFLKKYIHTKRNLVIIFIQLFVPIMFTISAELLNLIITSLYVRNEVILPLDLHPFTHNYISVSKDKLSSEFTMAYVSLFNGTSATVEPVETDKTNMTVVYAEKGIQYGVSNFNKLYLLGETSESENLKLTVTTFFNDKPLHMVGIVTSYLLQALIKLYMGDQFEIKMANHPIPIKDSRDRDSVGLALGLGFGIAFLLLIGMALMVTTFVVFLIKERASEAQHIQFVSGLKPWIYWAVNLAWDMVTFSLPSICILMIFVAFKEEAFTGGSRLGIVFLLLVHYGCSVLPFQYLLQFIFLKPAGGVAFLALINLGTGAFTLLATYVMSIPRLGLLSTARTIKVLFQIVFPNFCFAQSFMNIYANYHISKGCNTWINLTRICIRSPNMTCCPSCMGDSCAKWTDNYLSLDDPGIGRYLLAMAAQAVVFFVLVNLVDYRVFHRLWYLVTSSHNLIVHDVTGEEDDVAAERTRISQLTSQQLCSTHNVLLQDFAKYFSTLCAVDHLSLGVSSNELFGLLGVNGAGKTSTFRILTGQEFLTDGDAYLAGLSVKHDMKRIHKNIGYCPQGDALIEQLTGREHLFMYARIRGLRERSISRFVTSLIKDMTLVEHADKQIRTYSGGNKRKLNTAIALIGDPPIIFLDEPTTGVDPAARRQIWNVLSKIRDDGRTIILTSHSMEECDALCTRLAIMVNGRFVCLGSPQHLKNKFGHGYTVLARVGCNTDGQSMVEDFVQFIQSRFPGHADADVQENYVSLHLSDHALSLSSVFGTLEEAKDHYAIEDYSVSQTTLQEIFIQFAKHQVPPNENKKLCCKRYVCCC